MKKVDIAIVGLGAVGSAALYFLSKTGKNILGLDRFDPPHEMGSSHGETRITRLAVGEGEEYVQYAKRSQQNWMALQEELNISLIDQCGGILLDSGEQPWGKHGGSDFFENTVQIANDSKIPYSLWTSKELKKKFPQFNLGRKGKAYFEPTAGIVYPDRIIRSQIEIAERNGAEIKVHSPVKSIYSKNGFVILELKETQIQAKRVLISAGGWVKDFLPKEERDSYKICRQVLHWLELENFVKEFEASPVYMWGFGPSPEDFIYGFPSLDGQTVKLASESFLEVGHPSLLNRSVSKEEQENFWNEKIKGKIKGVRNSFLKSKVCFYTVRDDSKFVIKPMPNIAGSMLVSACSGHGFKHSSAIGEQLANRLLASLI